MCKGVRVWRTQNKEQAGMDVKGLDEDGEMMGKGLGLPR
jgi:hypothetical protein